MDENASRAVFLGVSVFVAIITLSVILTFYRTAKDTASVANRHDITNTGNQRIDEILNSKQISGIDLRYLINYYSNDDTVEINVWDTQEVSGAKIKINTDVDDYWATSYQTYLDEKIRPNYYYNLDVDTSSSIMKISAVSSDVAGVKSGIVDMGIIPPSTPVGDPISSGEAILFVYTGSAQEITLDPGKYVFELWGAAGGYPEGLYDGAPSGRYNKKCGGSYIKVDVYVRQTTTIYIYVGGKGSPNIGGYNGGGDANGAYGGGGATDMRLIGGDASDIVSKLSRFIVAAGGGGCSSTIAENSGYGGPGAWLGWGYTANGWGTNAGKGGDVLVNQTDFIGYEEDPQGQGTLGQGGKASVVGAGGGGGGYYGGSAAKGSTAGGGGGLSYLFVDERGARGEFDDPNRPMPGYVTTKYKSYVEQYIDPILEYDSDIEYWSWK